MIATRTLWGIALSTAAVVFLSIFCDQTGDWGLFWPGMVVTASLWIGIPQASLWWTTRDIRRQMRREVADLIHDGRSAGSGSGSAPRL